MVPDDKNINTIVVHTYTNSLQSENTRTDRDSKSKDDVEISGNEDSDFVSSIDEDSSNEVLNITEDSQSKEYHEINGQENNCDSDFISFLVETNDFLNNSKGHSGNSDVDGMLNGSDFDKNILRPNGYGKNLTKRNGYGNIHDSRGRPDGCEAKQRKSRGIIHEAIGVSDINVGKANCLYETWLKRDCFYETQDTAVGFEIKNINENAFDGSSNREDPDGCEEDTRTDIIHDKKQNCSIFWEMQMISRKSFDMQLFLWKTDTITLVWIIVKIGMVITATIMSIVKLGIVVTATIVFIVKLEMVEMNLVNEVDTCTNASQQGQFLFVSDIENPKEDHIHRKVNYAILSKESKDYIEYKKEDDEMQEKEQGLVIIDIDDKELVVEVQKGKYNIESKHASDNSQQNEDGINSRKSVVGGQCIDGNSDGKRVIGKMQRKVGDMVGAKVWLENSLKENEIVGEKAVGDILETEDYFNDEMAVVDIRGKTNELVCQRVDEILGKSDDFNGERLAAKVKEEYINIGGENTEEEDELEAKTPLKEIQGKHVDIGDYKADDKILRNDDHIDRKKVSCESVEKNEETAGKSQRHNNDFDGENVGIEIAEKNDDTNCKKAVGEILETGDDVDGEETACWNSEKNEKCGDVGGSNDMNKMQEEEKKEEIIPRRQKENINDKRPVGGNIKDIDHTKAVNEMGIEDNLKDTKLFDDQDDKGDNGSTTNAVVEIQEATSNNINEIVEIKAIRDSLDNTKSTVIKKFKKDIPTTDKNIKMPSLISICPNGNNFHQVERSRSKTVHTPRDRNHFEKVILLLVIYGIPLAGGASNELSTKVTWSLQTHPAVFGSNATLCCIIQNPDISHMAWVRDPNAMIVATGNSPSNPMKYSASVEPRGNITYYRLTIINVDMTDVNINYKCESGFIFLEKKLELKEESFVMKPSSKETAINITRENGMITVLLGIRNLYPRPDCFFSSKKEKINGNVSLEEKGKLFNVKMTFSISEDMCEKNISAYCALGQETVSIDLPSSNNSWTHRCLKDRHGDNSVLIVTVIISITLVFIVLLIGLLLKKYFARNCSYAFKLVLKSEQPVFVHV
ncbi:uncharacterized protein LOC127737633 [Mytilus californianus]|uniref:uncharacterized protein LOC127737633 n=1 Tax=Mytilus californianus TaxID=6549 RepID=UPI0022466D49|nr:uncharacterized protein LOC127737633 [Mytilus californianus]